MDNVIQFKPKTKPKIVETATYQQSFDQLLSIVRKNIEILSEYESGFVSIHLSPIYFKDNDKREIWEEIFRIKREALVDLLSDLESTEFMSTLEQSDFPKILYEYVDFTDGAIPITVTIPLVKCIFTLVMHRLPSAGNIWVISEIYANHRSITQHVFEQLMVKNDSSEGQMFLGETE